MARGRSSPPSTPATKTVGLPEALAASQARVKAMVINLDFDRGIQTLGVTDLVDRTLQFMGDPENQKHLITHALYNAASGKRPTRNPFDASKAPDGRSRA